MNKGQTCNTTYAHFLQIWEGSIKSTEAIDYESHLQKIMLSDELADVNPSVMHLVDLQNMKYLYMGKNIYRHSGYTAEEFLTKGGHFTFSLLHPEDKYEITQKVMPTLISFLKGLPIGEFKKYKFAYNYRFKKVDGQYAHVYKQEIILQTDQQGNPLLMLGVANDISHLKKDTHISLSVSEFNSQPATTRYLYQSQQDFISRREMEVLRLILAGETTEQIADKLCLSPYTVKNHRRNMIERTGVKNIAGVIQLALSKGVLQ